MDSKVCTDCLLDLPLSAFKKHPHCTFGVRPQCKQCSYANRGKKRIAPLPERFWLFVTKGSPDECWEWQGNRNKRGYGLMYARTTTVLANRISYELHFGPLEPHLFACHTCDNPPCVNPAHLWAGTHKQNMEDATRKKRWPHGPMPERQGENSPKAKLSNAEAKSIVEALQQGKSLNSLAKEYGVSKSTISLIKRNKHWRHIPRD